MAWADLEGNIHYELPKRIRLNDKTTRTADAITEEVILQEGWIKVEPAPFITISSVNTQEEELTIEETDSILLSDTYNSTNSTISI